MSIEQDLIRYSEEGSVGTLSPSHMLSPLTFDPVKPEQEDITTPLDRLTAIGAGFSNTAASTIRAGIDVGYRLLADREEAYNPFYDTQLKTQGDDFIARYGSSFVDSPNPEFTAYRIQSIKDFERNNEYMAKSPVSGMVGSFLGSVSDPSAALALLLPAAGVSRVAVGSLQIGALSGGQSLAESTYNPTKTLDDVGHEALGGFLLGGILLGAGEVAGGISSKSYKSLKDVVSGKQINIDQKLVAESEAFTKGVGAEATTSAEFSIAKTNPAFNATLAGIKGFTPELRLLTSTNPAMRTEAAKFLNTEVFSTSNLTGKAEAPNILHTAAMDSINLYKRLEDDVYSTFGKYQQDGGKLKFDEYMDKVQSHLFKLEESKDSSIITTAAKVRELIKYQGKKIQDSKILGDDFVPGEDYFPQKYNFEKLTNERFIAIDDLKKAIKDKAAVDYNERLAAFEAKRDADVRRIVEGNLKLKEKTTAELENLKEDLIYSKKVGDEISIAKLEAQIARLDSRIANFEAEKTAALEKVNLGKPKLVEDDIIDGDAEKIYELLVEDSLGRYKNRTEFKASALQERVLDLPNWFMKKYGRSNILETLGAHFKQTSMELALFKEYGTRDYWKAIQERIDTGYHKEINKLELKKDISDAERNAEAARLGKEREQNLSDMLAVLDIATGKWASQFSPTARAIASVAKATQYVRLMGQVVLSSLSDLSQIYSKTLSKSDVGKFISESTNGIAKQLKFFKGKEEAALLGIMSERSMSASRSAMYADMEDANLLTKWEKRANLGTYLFSKLNLFDKWNDTLLNAAAEQVATKLVVWSNKLVKGELAENSAGMKELRQLRVDNKLAKQIVDQFNLNKTVEEFGGHKVLLSNFEAWSPSVLASVGGIIRAKSQNLVFSPDAGSRPLWLTKPFGSIIGQFLGYTIGSAGRVLLPRLQRMSGVSAEHSKEAISKTFLDISLGALSGVLKDVINGRDLDTDPNRVLLYGIERSAALSLISYPSAVADRLYGAGFGGMLGVAKFGKFSQMQDATSLFVGPTGGFINDSVKLTQRLANGEANEKDLKRFTKLLPGSNLWMWSWAVNQIGQNK